MYKFLSAILLLLSSCSNKQPDPKPDILTLKEMGDLATVEYTITKIIKANDNKTWFKMGDRKILMSCEATIKAGVDMSSINDNSFTINGKDIQLQLPPAKVISLSIPPDKIKVEYQEIGVFRQAFKAEERNMLAVQAQAQINRSIDSLGILDQAKANTSLFVNSILKQLGYQKVTITFSVSQPIKQLQ